MARATTRKSPLGGGGGRVLSVLPSGPYESRAQTRAGSSAGGGHPPNSRATHARTASPRRGRVIPRQSRSAVHIRTRSSRARNAARDRSARRSASTTSSLPSETRSSRARAQRYASAGVNGTGFRGPHRHHSGTASRRASTSIGVRFPRRRSTSETLQTVIGTPYIRATSSAIDSACPACGSRSGGSDSKTSSRSMSESGLASPRAREPNSEAWTRSAGISRRTLSMVRRTADRSTRSSAGPETGRPCVVEIGMRGE